MTDEYLRGYIYPADRDRVYAQLDRLLADDSGPVLDTLILGIYRCYKRVLLKMSEIRDIGRCIMSAELTSVGTEPLARS